MTGAVTVATDVAEPADISLPLIRLHAGEPLVELLHDDVAVRAATLDALLGRLAENEIKLIWIGNPLRSPLTIERIFLQAAGAEADLRVERSPEELVAMLRSAIGDVPRCVLVVHRPETLDPETRDMLARIAPLLAQTTPPIQFLFCGSNRFRLILPAARELIPHPEHRPAPFLPALTFDPGPPPRSSAREKLPLLLLLAIALFGAITLAGPADTPVRITALAPDPAPLPAPRPAPLPTPLIAPAPDPTPPAAALPLPAPAPALPSVNVTALRHDFDEFLAQQPSRAARLSPEQRDALFDEFLARQKRSPAWRPDAAR